MFWQTGKEIIIVDNTIAPLEKCQSEVGSVRILLLRLSALMAPF